MKDTVILAKDIILRTMQGELDGEFDDLFNKMCITSLTRVSDKNLITNKWKSLIWDLANRILNTKIGQLTKSRRSKCLTRVNDVSFRPSVTVKSDKRNN